MSSSDYYVYILFREDLVTPFYVGKGRGQRVKAHSRISENRRNKGVIKERIASKILGNLGYIPYKIIFRDIQEQEALSAEAGLIQSLGRICDGSGILANITVGGEGASGVKQSEEAKQRKRDTHMQPHIREQKRHRLLETYSRPEVRKKLSDAQKRIRSDPETAQKLHHIREVALAPAEVQQRRLNNLRAVQKTPEYLDNLSKGQSLRWSNPEARARQSAALKAAWKKRKQG